MYKDELSVFIPNSFLSESKDLKVRTFKVGILGRALAVFQIDNVVIYNDDHIKNENGEEDGEFIAEVLNYMNTPQYLRKSAFPIRPELKHVGILPPLRAPHHPVNSQPDVGDYKEQLTVKKIFNFKITKIAKKEVIVTPDKPDDIYWGYNVISSNKSLKNSLKLIKPDFVVETTRYGDYIDSIFDELKLKVDEFKNIAILFGGPYSSIPEDVSSGNWEHIKLNTVPNQGTETVRTEEAVVATLSLFNILRF